MHPPAFPARRWSGKQEDDFAFFVGQAEDQDLGA